MLRFLAVCVFAAFLVAGPAFGDPSGNFTLEDIRRVLEQSQNMTKDQDLKKLIEQFDWQKMQSQAQEAVRSFEQRKDELQSMTEALTERLTGRKASELARQHGLSPRQGVLGPDEMLVVFVSSSVPLETLRKYASDLEALNEPQAVMAMRGFVGGAKKFRPTLEFIWRVIAEDPNLPVLKENTKVRNVSIHIDPVLFAELNVTEVPAVAYVKGLNQLEPSCHSEGKLQAWVLYGDMSLEYALEVLSRETKVKALEELLARLKNRGFYQKAQGAQLDATVSKDGGRR